MHRVVVFCWYSADATLSPPERAENIREQTIEHLEEQPHGDAKSNAVERVRVQGENLGMQPTRDLNASFGPLEIVDGEELERGKRKAKRREEK